MPSPASSAATRSFRSSTPRNHTAADLISPILAGAEPPGCSRLVRILSEIDLSSYLLNSLPISYLRVASASVRGCRARFLRSIGGVLAGWAEGMRVRDPKRAGSSVGGGSVRVLQLFGVVPGKPALRVGALYCSPGAHFQGRPGSSARPRHPALMPRQDRLAGACLLPDAQPLC